MTTKAVSYTTAVYLVDHDDRLADAISFAMTEAETNCKHQRLLTRCAAQLWATSWLQVQCLSCGDPGGLVREQDLIKAKRKEAVEQLQRVGLLPTTLMGWVLAFAFRWAVERFLSFLISEWLRGDGRGTNSSS